MNATQERAHRLRKEHPSSDRPASESPAATRTTTNPYYLAEIVSELIPEAIEEAEAALARLAATA